MTNIKPKESSIQYKAYGHGLWHEKENSQLFCCVNAVVDKNLSGTEWRSKLACL